MVYNRPKGILYKENCWNIFISTIFDERKNFFIPENKYKCMYMTGLKNLNEENPSIHLFLLGCLLVLQCVCVLFWDGCVLKDSPKIFLQNKTSFFCKKYNLFKIIEFVKTFMDNQPIILISEIGCFPYLTPIHPLLFFI